jgi:hypothetical protein
MAEASSGHPDENLTWTRFRHRDLDQFSRSLPCGEPDRLHVGDPIT